jgi:hypothetical protein
LIERRFSGRVGACPTVERVSKCHFSLCRPFAMGVKTGCS